MNAIKIPDRFKLPLLGACFLGCLSTIFLPYNSFHVAPNSVKVSSLTALNGYCVAITDTYKIKCANNNIDDKQCATLQKDMSKCIKAVVKAYREINFKCLKQSAMFRVCSSKWCNGDETSGDIATPSKKDSTGTSNGSSGDGGDDCHERCRTKADSLKECERKIRNRWFVKYGMKTDDIT
mmetsp:Transcript_8706/g.15766  ORF Transcript_8706/g.15766 Transcript_8706/m.15766 type:complete len:180 (-) Transcript_8706:21-560(-)